VEGFLDKSVETEKLLSKVQELLIKSA